MLLLIYMKILILVENLNDLDYLHPVLENENYQCKVEDNVFSGLYAIKEENFDVVITELSMEEINGLIVAEYVMQKKPQMSVIIYNNNKAPISQPELLSLQTVYTVSKGSQVTLSSVLLEIGAEETEESKWEKIIF